MFLKLCCENVECMDVQVTLKSEIEYLMCEMAIDIWKANEKLNLSCSQKNKHL